jgi:hypothetical protein
MCYIIDPITPNAGLIALVNHRIIKEYIHEIESTGGYRRAVIEAQDIFMGLASHEIEWCGVWCNSNRGGSIEVIVCHWDWRDVRHSMINGKLYDDGSSRGVFNGLLSYTNPIEMIASYVFGELKIPSFIGGMLFGPIISSLNTEKRFLDLFFILPSSFDGSSFNKGGWIMCKVQPINGYLVVPGFKPIRAHPDIIIFRHPQHKTKIYIVPPIIGDEQKRWFDGINLIWDRPIKPDHTVMDDYVRCYREIDCDGHVTAT